MSVYVLGAVARPQAIPFGNTGRTILQVLSMAGGPKPGAAQLKAIRIIRSSSPISGELIVYDATSILSGRGPDFPLEPGDVIYVPSGALGDWNAAIAEILPSLTLISGILTPIALVQGLNTN
jgi:polysaccharide export outer membrane protein